MATEGVMLLLLLLLLLTGRRFDPASSTPPGADGQAEEGHEFERNAEPWWKPRGPDTAWRRTRC